MQHSETLKEIAPALVKAQSAIRSAIKDATNPHFRSKYADLSSVVEAVKPALVANGITFLQGVADAEGGVAVETMLLHTSGEWISSTLRIPASKNDAQGYGSAITYGRRYGLQSLCGVPSDDDDGNAAVASKGLPASQRADFESAIDAAVDPDALKKVWKTVSQACRDAADTEAYQTLKDRVTKRADALKATA